jgi:RimJ/RimL family protein N-acetyltransferase
VRVVETERLILRRVTLEEARGLVSGTPLASTPCADDYPTVDTPDAFNGFIAARTEALGPWIIVRRSDGLVIGDIGFEQKVADGTVTGGYGLAPSAWNRGYATEAVRALVAHTLSQPGIRRIEADTHVTNAASRRVMEKAGMRLEREEDGQLWFAVERPPTG